MRKQWVLGLVLALSATPALAVTFNAMDTNHDGKIKKKEFYGHLAHFSHYDRNDDGMISKKEFKKSGFPGEFFYWQTEHTGAYLDSKEFYDGIFSVYDRDKNGNWDKTEFRDAKKAGLLR